MDPGIDVDLSRPRRIHLIGAGGTGMSAIAEILAGNGHHVSGSDQADGVPLRRLAERGVVTHVGHDAAHVAGAELVFASTAIGPDNPEVVAARAAELPMLRRADVLAAITRQYRSIAVAGTHGKTTTSAMLTMVLRGTGFDPSFIVGGDLTDLGTGAAVGSGEWLVVEADESDGTFVELDTSAVIVTNIEPDHLEHYGGFDGLRAAFDRFVIQADGPKVMCVDDPLTAELVQRLRSAGTDAGVVTYGTSPDATWRLTEILPTPDGVAATLTGPDAGPIPIRLAQPGMHNLRNATAAVVTAVELGAGVDDAVAAIGRFGGVGRRFERRGSIGGIDLVDDYAHLPTEVAAALQAARSLEADRLVAVFQPHRYSRTEQLWATFTDAFVDADVLILTGIYAAGESPRAGISSSLIADDIRAAHPEADVRHIESLDDVVAHLVDELRDGDLCLTLGAGDLTRIPDRVLDGLGIRDDG